MNESDADRALTDLQLPVDVGSENSVVLRRGTIEATDDELVVRRGGMILAQAPFAMVRARRTRLSLGSAVRMRVGDVKLALDFSGTDRRRRLLLLEVLLPISFFLDVKAGRRATRALFDALRARGADVGRHRP